MAITNHERVGKAMELLKAGLGPFVEREFKNTFKDRAAAEALRYQGDDRINAKKTVAEWDAAAPPQTHVGVVERGLSTDLGSLRA
jgi:hypothetical protein